MPPVTAGCTCYPAVFRLLILFSVSMLLAETAMGVIFRVKNSHDISAARFGVCITPSFDTARSVRSWRWSCMRISTLLPGAGNFLLGNLPLLGDRLWSFAVTSVFVIFRWLNDLFMDRELVMYRIITNTSLIRDPVVTKTTQLSKCNLPRRSCEHLVHFHCPWNGWLVYMQFINFRNVFSPLTKKTFVAESTDSASNKAFALGISPPCWRMSSALLFRVPPTPSGAPLPCPLSNMFQVAHRMPYVLTSVDNR